MKKILVMLMGYPTLNEANVYGEYEIAAEIIERDHQKFSPPMGHKEFWKIALGRQKLRGFWPAGSLTRSGMYFLKICWDISLQFGFFTFIKKYILQCC